MRNKKLPVKEQPKPPGQLPVKVLAALKVLILPLLCCLSLLSNAVPVRDSTGIKDYTIKGKVVDERGEPMPGMKGEDLKDIPSPSLTNLLQGRVAGMNVTNMTGSPGGGCGKIFFMKRPFLKFYL